MLLVDRHPASLERATDLPRPRPLATWPSLALSRSRAEAPPVVDRGLPLSPPLSTLRAEGPSTCLDACRCEVRATAGAEPRAGLVDYCKQKLSGQRSKEPRDIRPMDLAGSKLHRELAGPDDENWTDVAVLHPPS